MTAKPKRTRYGIEKSFRDIGVSAMHVKRPNRRGLLMHRAWAIAMMSLLGAAGEAMGYDRWFRANAVQRRTQSLFRQRPMIYAQYLNWSQERMRIPLRKFTVLI